MIHVGESGPVPAGVLRWLRWLRRANAPGSAPAGGRWWIRAAAALAVVLLLGAALPARAAEATVRRFALVVGANDGGAGRPKLRYADTDAVAVAKVLVELGGVALEDRVLLLDPDRRTLERNLASLGERLARARATAGRVEFVFYYSGHSDEEGLLLRGQHFRYPELRRRLADAAADVRIAILDSCASGALTRDKGGVHRAPFLIDTSAQVKGHAFLTSASAHEAAQESDRLRASFFTHALLTGLRGAADLGRDGRVTLNEAYYFAFQETLARTERTLHGAQHPNFDIQLVGTGDLVMTDLRGTGAGLRLEEAVVGRVFVRDGEGNLVAELVKPAGRPVELGLDPGAYRVTVDRNGQYAEAELALVQGWRTELRAAELTPVLAEAAAARGDVSISSTPPGYRRVHWNLTLFPDLSLADAFSGGRGSDDRRRIQEFAVNLTLGRSARLEGAEVSLVASLVEEHATGVEVAVGGSNVGGRMTGLQVGFLGNVAGELSGLQLATGANAVRGNAGWGQVASGFNWTSGRFAGAQLASGLNWAEELEGFQGVTGVNLVRGPAEGVQFAGALNLASRLEGLQVAGAVNWADRSSGVQLAGVFNYSQVVDGLQLAVLNIGGEVSGVQLGVVNIATGAVDAQVGLVNVADDAGVPVGLLNFSREGLHHLDLWANETTPANLSVRLGGRRVYGLLSGGMAGGEERRLAAGLGLGVRLLASERLFVDLDALTQYVFDPAGELATGGGNSLQTARLGVGFDLGPVAVIGGPTYNVLASYGTDPGERVPLAKLLPGEPLGAREWQSGTVLFRGWPGLFLGMQL